MSKPNRVQKPAQPTQKPQAVTAQRSTVAPKPKAREIQNDTLVFGRENYIWMLIGIAVMAVGYVMMGGGSMPTPDVWDENVIYSPMRILVAPILILAGLAIEVYAIFKKSAATPSTEIEQV